MITTTQATVFALDTVGSSYTYLAGEETIISSYTSQMNDSIQDVSPTDAGPNPSSVPSWYNGMLLGGYLLIIIVGMTANSAVLAITMIDQFRNSVNCSAMNTINTYIINLASADLLYIFGAIFWAWTNYNKDGWRFGDFGCRTVYSLEFITLHASAYTLTFMTIERYLAIMYPMTSLRFRNLSFARKISTVIWLSAIVLALSPLLFMREVSFPIDGKIKMRCIFTLGREALDNYYTAVAVITFIIPSIVMIAVYTKMFASIFGTIRQSVDPDTQLTRQLKSSSRKAAKIVFLIVSVWLLCFFPFWLNHFLSKMQISFDKTRVFALCVQLLSYLNSMVNPFLYTLMPKRYNVWKRLRSKPPPYAQPNGEIHF